MLIENMIAPEFRTTLRKLNSLIIYIPVAAVLIDFFVLYMMARNGMGTHRQLSMLPVADHRLNVVILVAVFMLLGDVLLVIMLARVVRKQIARLRSATTIWRQATPRPMMAKCWKSALSDQVVWNVVLSAEACSAAEPARYYTSMLLCGKRREIPVPEHALLYTLDTAPDEQVLRFDDGTMLMLSPSIASPTR